MAITAAMRQLARKRLDARLAALTSLPITAPLAPAQGWIRTIREALGMPRHVLARRLHVTEKMITEMELSEAEGTLPINTLKQAAEAIECDLVFAFVPRSSLEKVVNDRRAQLVSDWLQSRVLHTMALSGQPVAQEDLPSRVVREVERLFPDDHLWD